MSNLEVTERRFGLGRKSPHEKAIAAATGRDLQTVLELMPDSTRIGNGRFANFTSVSLGPRLLQGPLTARIVDLLDLRGELGVPGDSAIVLIDGNQGMGHEIIIGNFRSKTQIQAVLDKNYTVSELTLRKAGETFAHADIANNRQLLVRWMLECVARDLEAARDYWVEGNEKCRDKFFEDVKSLHEEGTLLHLSRVLRSLEIASSGKNTIIEALLVDEADKENTPMDIVVDTTLPLDENVATTFFNEALRGNNSVKGRFDVRYDYSAAADGVNASRPWMLYQTPDGKIIGVTQSGRRDFDHRRRVAEDSFEEVLATGNRNRIIQVLNPLVIVDYTGNFKNAPLSTEVSSVF